MLWQGVLGKHESEQQSKQTNRRCRALCTTAEFGVLTAPSPRSGNWGAFGVLCCTSNGILESSSCCACVPACCLEKPQGIRLLLPSQHLQVSTMSPLLREEL